jgi:hypothetical protein
MEELMATKVQLGELQQELAHTRREHQIVGAGSTSSAAGAAGAAGGAGHGVVEQQNAALRAECKRLAQQNATLKASVNPEGVEYIQVL